MVQTGRKMLMLLLLLVCTPRSLLAVGHVSAEDDGSEEIHVDSVIEDEEEDDDEAVVDEDRSASDTDVEDKTDADSTGPDVTSHTDADTTILFVSGEDFPANEIVRFLVGFTNKGSQDFTIQSLEASFRYPQDYQFYVQNFTTLPLNTLVPPQTQASFEYSFIPAQPMAGRPFGLVILLNYRDAEGNVFQNAIYNQTVTITELDEELDGETVFMYVFLAGLVALAILGLYQVLDFRTRKRVPTPVETGTGGLKDVDMSWIPQENLSIMNRASPKASPRKRTKRAAGTDQ